MLNVMCHAICDCLLIKTKLGDVVHCDATMDPVVDYPVANPAFDAIIVTLCLEEACTTFEALKTTMTKLAAILKIGGHIIIFSVLEEIYYKVGEQVIKVTPYTEKQMIEAVTGAGLSLKEQYDISDIRIKKVVKDVYATMLGIVAQK